MTATITVDEVLGATAARFARGGRVIRNGRNPGRGTVHAVRIREEWMGVARLPVPACGSGVGGTTGRILEPTVDAVTCVHCKTQTAARAAAQYVPTPHQFELFGAAV